MTRTDLAKQFPDGYWANWQDEFGHNFFETHIDRTLEYDEVLGEKISGKWVLEVGAFPGLETAWLLHRGCNVMALDSPKYNPTYYDVWRTSHNIVQLEHDIVQGAVPDILRRFDVAIMSDVLLHIDGFPDKFMSWLCGAADDIYLINYSGDANIVPAIGHTLKAGHPIAGQKQIREFMVANGAEFVEAIAKSSREILIFKGHNDIRRTGVLPLQATGDGDALRSKVRSESDSDARCVPAS